MGPALDLLIESFQKVLLPLNYGFPVYLTRVTLLLGHGFPPPIWGFFTKYHTLRITMTILFAEE